MLLVQTVCKFFVPSGSGQAFVTMPILSPIATLTDMPQQTAVIAYQFGDGFTNMMVPTSALVMGALALARIPYGRRIRLFDTRERPARRVRRPAHRFRASS